MAPRTLVLAGIVAIVLAGYGLVNLAAYALLSRIFPVPLWAVAALGIFSVGCVFLQFAHPLSRAAYFLGMSWMGISFLLALLSPLPALLARVGLGMGGWLLAPALCIVAYAYYCALVPKVREVAIEVGKPCRPVRIVQITDLHLGAIYGPASLRRVVRKVNALAPDAVVITGDIVDGPLLPPGLLDPLRELRAPALFVTGNHEEYAGRERALRLVRAQGVRVLDGQRTWDIGDVRITGAAYGEDAIRAPVGARTHVLLRHLPIPARGFDMQLSGHTHKGQLWPLSYLVLLQFPVSSGLARTRDGVLYVSQGTGTWGPPLRLGSRSEITLITLEGPRARANP
jgi:uncharacterized protein